MLSASADHVDNFNVVPIFQQRIGITASRHHFQVPLNGNNTLFQTKLGNKCRQCSSRHFPGLTIELNVHTQLFHLLDDKQEKLINFVQYFLVFVIFPHDLFDRGFSAA